MSNDQLTSDGFEELADIDSNGDCVVDSYDVEFANLCIWQDINQDGGMRVAVHIQNFL